MIENGNEVDCLDIVNNDIQAIEYGIVESNRSDADSVSVIYQHIKMYSDIYVTQHEKTGLMYTKYTSSYYGAYLLYG